MNNKGFTLIELLAIIVILSIIIIVAAPNLNNQIKKSNDNTQSVLTKKIENASKIYVAKYYGDKVVSGSSTSITFTLSDLEKDGLLNLKGNDGCTAVKNQSIEVSISGRITYNYENIKNSGKCYK